MKENNIYEELDLSNTSDGKDEGKELPRCSMFLPTTKLIQTQPKHRRRLKSNPLKGFKVSSPGESNILSVICDNIYEDDIINDNINESMIKIESNINIKNTFDEKKKNKNSKKSNNISKEEKIKISKQKDENEDDDFPLLSRQHKKSFIFNNILKIKNIKCPRLLEEQWKFEKILLDYNIIDFTSKTIYFIIL